MTSIVAAIPAGVTDIRGIEDVVLAMAVLLAVAAVLAVLTKRLHLPLTLLLVTVGFLAGELARSQGIDLPLEGETFHDVVLFAFLPVLVFEAALLLPARAFVKELVPILTLAVVALAIAATLVGLFVHFGLGVGLTAALLFGSLISATDPVAVTQTFRELGVPKRLLVLVEGESLLNDGIAIVLFTILLAAALGTEEVSVLGGVGEFLLVFIGGAALGGVLGLGVAEISARLGRLPSTALTIAVAYGSFALGEQIGFSGVMASVSAGLVLSLLGRTLIPKEEIETWHAVWDALAFVANGILFLLIGLVIEARMMLDHLDAIAIGVAAVVISRPLAIIPVMPLVTRLARIPAVGMRNQLVVVWGGLRGGVALALVLAIPQELPEQERFVAMTAGVVLATLILNATTIAALVRFLGLDRPDRIGRWVAAAARFDGAHAAREELHATSSHSDIEGRLFEVEEASVAEIDEIDLTSEEHLEALMRRGLAVERRSFQELVDEGLLPQWHGRVALNALEDQLDELSLGRMSERGLFQAKGLGRLVYWVARRIHEGKLAPERFIEIAYRDLNARIKASSDAIEAIELLGRCPSVEREPLDRAIERFRGFHDKALADLETLGERAPPAMFLAAQRHYAADLARLSSSRELRHLSDLGLVSSSAVDHAAELITAYLETCERERLTIDISPEEDVGI